MIMAESHDRFGKSYFLKVEGFLNSAVTVKSIEIGRQKNSS